MKSISKGSDRDKSKSYLYEYRGILDHTGTLGPLFILGLIISIIIAGLFALNDIGYHYNGDICFGNLCLVGLGWIVVLVISIIVSIFSADEK